MLIAAKLLALIVFAYVFFLSGDCSDKTTTILGQLGLFITFVCSEGFRMYREGRLRRWQQEDAIALAKKTEATAQDVKQTTKEVIEKHEGTIQAKLDDQTTQLQQSMRTRVTDLGKNLDALVTEGPKRRSTDER